MHCDAIDDVILGRVARHAGVELQPMCVFFGGIVAQVGETEGEERGEGVDQ